MRLVVTCVCLLVSVAAFSQSKKELEKEVARLKAEIEQLKKPKEIDLNDLHKKACYGIGTLVATNIKMQALDSLDVDALLMAIQDVLKNRPVKMNQQEASQVVQSYIQQAMELKAKKAKEEGIAFLEQNKSKEGVQTTASGLQYKVITKGSGKSPAGSSDRVTVHYTGHLLNGTVFDSSVDRGQPATFSLNQVIRGWTEALQMMKEGDKWTLYVPSELAYGERGYPPQIPPHATLIFDVELIKVN